MAEQPFEPLLAELRDVAELADPVPAAVVAAAKAALTWRTVDAELAELTADSSLAPAGVRAAQAARLLTFEGPGVEIEVEIVETGPTRRLTGQVVPVTPAGVTIRWGAGVVDVTADDLGRFTATDVPAGSVRLEVRRADDRHPVVTSWVSI